MLAGMITLEESCGALKLDNGILKLNSLLLSISCWIHGADIIICCSRTYCEKDLCGI